MRRFGVLAVLAVLAACGSTSPPPVTCGSSTCNAGEICLKQCFANSCAFPLPSSGQCPSGYVASETKSNQDCCVVQPPPHCVIPAQATQSDCDPYGLFQNNDGTVVCECLI